MILQKLEELLTSPMIQFDPTPLLLAGTQILYKFEEIYSHVKGLTTKLDAIVHKCEENEAKINDLTSRVKADPDFDFGNMHLGS